MDSMIKLHAQCFLEQHAVQGELINERTLTNEKRRTPQPFDILEDCTRSYVRVAGRALTF